MSLNFSVLQEYFKKLKSKKTEKSSGGNAKKKPLEQEQYNFLPFVSHYNQNTIITKNGELIQVLTDFFSIDKDECLETIKRWVSNFLNIEVSKIENTDNTGAQHRLYKNR